MFLWGLSDGWVGGGIRENRTETRLSARIWVSNENSRLGDRERWLGEDGSGRCPVAQRRTAWLSSDWRLISTCSRRAAQRERGRTRGDEVGSDVGRVRARAAVGGRGMCDCEVCVSPARSARGGVCFDGIAPCGVVLDVEWRVRWEGG